MSVNARVLVAGLPKPEVWGTPGHDLGMFRSRDAVVLTGGVACIKLGGTRIVRRSGTSLLCETRRTPHV